MSVIEILMFIIRTSIVLIGMTLFYISMKKYLKNRLSNHYLALAISFLFLVIGALLEGILYGYFNVEILYAHIIDSIFVLMGFIMLLYAIIRTV